MYCSKVLKEGLPLFEYYVLVDTSMKKMMAEKKCLGLLDVAIFKPYTLLKRMHSTSKIVKTIFSSTKFIQQIINIYDTG